jgi:hypothetical protein
MTHDLHPPGQNSPDIPISLMHAFFTLRFQIGFTSILGNRMSGYETIDDYVMRPSVWGFRDLSKTALPVPFT